MVELLADHPGWEELKAYSQGRLAPENASTVEEHLAQCASCCERLENAPADSFLGRLRAAGATTTGTPGARPGLTAKCQADPPCIPAERVDHPRYRVLGLVGRGGMGAVYRAEHRRMERLVALKVIHPVMMQNPAAVQRFHQEVRAAARLDHPNIVSAFDADQIGELHFLVMEYVEGTSLADRVGERGPLSPAEACAYVRQAALGLQHAHEQGLVHRDIKPHNLMLTPEGRVKILDFGLARLRRVGEGPGTGDVPSGSLTGAGTVMGTADYIAPEQAVNPRTADIRADVYSLGCTLFHLLTGRPPFPDGGVTEKLAQHASTPLPSVQNLRPGSPAGLDAVLARMTAKDPADRHATPAEVAQALVPFCPVAGSRFAFPRKRLLLGAALAAVAGVLAVAVFRPGADGSGVSLPTTQSPEPIARDTPDPRAEESEEDAIRAIGKLGGWVRRDNQIPGNPVVSVSLANAAVTADDLRAVAAFKQLRLLALNRAPVTDAGLKHLTGLTQLTKLVLADTRVTDAGMKYVGELKQLEELELQSTQVSDAGLKHLGGLTKLRSLFLIGARVTYAGMADVGRLKKLTNLRLDMTAITDVGLKSLTGLTELTILGLFSARAIGDEGMKSVAQLEQLQSLDLCGTRVTDQGLKELGRLKRLSSLRIAGLKVTDAGVKSLRGLADLQLLDLAQTSVTDEGLKEVARHRGLTNLDLQGAKNVTDAGVKELTGLPHLEVLGLARTGVTDAGLRELARCQRLRFLNLLQADKVTDARVAELRKARPTLQIQR